MKLDYDKEINILNDLHELDQGDCLIISDDFETENYWNTAKIIDDILSENYLIKWVDNTCSSFPPDYINNEHSLIMEVMRFDDHSRNGNRNPVLARERQLSNEIKTFSDIFSNSRTIINAVTDLPTQEDHNYHNLYTSFQRTIKKHLSKSERYKKNYPNSKLVFLALNETSGNYFEALDKAKTLGRPHLIFFDNRFLNVFMDSELDFLIIYSPYNYTETTYGILKLPKAVIFDIKRLKNSRQIQCIDYDESNMVSNEL